MLTLAEESKADRDFYAQFKEAAWITDMRRFFAEHGYYRPADLLRLLGPANGDPDSEWEKCIRERQRQRALQANTYVPLAQSVAGTPAAQVGTIPVPAEAEKIGSHP